VNSLPALLTWMTNQLQAWPACVEVQVIENRPLEPGRFRIKVRARLVEPYQLQIRYDHNRGHYDYSSQLFSDQPVVRWDNKEDAGPVPTAPHHFHTAAGDIVESPLTGDPEHDWPLVRMVMEQFVTTHSKPPEQPDRFA